MNENKKALIAAALILAGFGGAAFFLPTLMLAAVEISPYFAGAVGGLFLVSFFLVFWLRARSQRKRR